MDKLPYFRIDNESGRSRVRDSIFFKKLKKEGLICVQVKVRLGVDLEK